MNPPLSTGPEEASVRRKDSFQGRNDIMKRIAQLLTSITAFCAVVGALAQVPSIINYQGRLSVGGTNVFDGAGQFKFALVNGGTNLNRQATATAAVNAEFLTSITVTDGGQGTWRYPLSPSPTPQGQMLWSKSLSPTG